jgi:alkylhydroperoxidase/carboxymuconolactone decarboxylase family protein YurZ
MEIPDSVPPFLRSLYENDQKLYDMVMNDMRAANPEQGAIPTKYRLLLSMVADGVLFHPDGVVALAAQSRAAGATEDEINEAVRIIYLSGGMVALLNSLGAYKR